MHQELVEKSKLKNYEIEFDGEFVIENISKNEKLEVVERGSK